MSDRLCNICNQCGRKFATRQKIKGKIRRFYARKFCLRCVPFKTIANQFKNKKPSTRICKRCKKKFISLTVFNGRKVELYLRKHCLECVPFGENVNKHLSRGGEKVICAGCGKIYVYRRRSSNDNLSKCFSCRRTESYKRMKRRCVQYKGGKCVSCEFNAFTEALVFHHLDPTKKDFGIAQVRKRIGRAKLKTELDKCILLCMNCHAGLHAGYIKLKKKWK